MKLSQAIVMGGDASALEGVFALLKTEKIEPRGNPNVFVREYSRFGIDEARELRDRSFARAIGSARRVFIVITPTITIEAQNALLKTIEEPPADALFFFIVRSPHTLLPTVRSRVQIHASDFSAVPLVDEKRFLAAAPAARLEMLKPLLEKGEDDARDVGAIITFLSSLERRIAQAGAYSARDAAEAIYRARKYAGDKGALVKPLLEQVALLVPKM